MEELKQTGEVRTEYDRFPIQAVQFGNDLTLVAICGEVVVDYALRLKRELAGTSGISFGSPATPITCSVICRVERVLRGRRV